MASTSCKRKKSVGRGMLVTRYYYHRRKAMKGGLLKKNSDKTSASGSGNLAHRILLGLHDGDGMYPF